MPAIAWPIADAGAANNWRPRFALPGPQGNVVAMAEYGGHLIAAGDFHFTGYTRSGGIARLATIGGSWEPLTEPGFDAPVQALATFGGLLIAGGDFQANGATPLSRVGAWNGTQWVPMGSGFDGAVHDLVVFQDQLYAAGDFSHSGFVTTGAVARWTEAGWQPVGAESNPFHTPLRLAASGERLYLSRGSTVRAWDGLAWTTIGQLVGGGIADMAVLDGGLVVAGAFNGYVTRWNGMNWTPFGAPLYQDIASLAVIDGELCAGGDGEAYGNGPGLGVFRWHAGAWQPLGPNVSDGVDCLASFEGRIVAGGRFTSLDPGPRLRHVMAWDGQEWGRVEALRPDMGGLDGPVHAFAHWEGGVVAGGDFENAGDLRVNHLAFWDGDTWSSIGDGVDGPVRALLVRDGTLCVGGTFQRAGGAGVDGLDVGNLAIWTGAEWTSPGNGVGGGNFPSVNALADYSGDLCVGGRFTTAGGLPIANLARWNGSQWLDIGAAAPSYFVYALREFEGRLVVGGGFTGIGGLTNLGGVAAWDGAHWAGMGRLSKCCTPWGHGQAFIYDFEVVDGALVAGGSFNYPAGNGIARWTGNDWESMSDFTAIPSDILDVPEGTYITAIEVVDGTLVAGGYFLESASGQLNNLARWTGQEWLPFGLGVDGPVNALIGFDGLLAGGDFTVASGIDRETPSSHIAQWQAAVPIELLDFRVQVAAAGARLDWRIAGDLSDVAGFHVHREPAGQPRRQLTTAPLAGRMQYTFTDPAPPDGPVDYWLSEVGRSGAVRWHGPVRLEADRGAPLARLGASTPNPFRSSTAIVFTTARTGHVVLRLCDVTGRVVRHLAAGPLDAGDHRITWDGTTDLGGAVSAGLYFLQLVTADGDVQTGRLVRQ